MLLSPSFILFHILAISSSLVFNVKQETPVKARKKSAMEQETIFKYPPLTLAQAFSSNSPHNSDEVVLVKNGVEVPLTTGTKSSIKTVWNSPSTKREI